MIFALSAGEGFFGLPFGGMVLRGARSYSRLAALAALPLGRGGTGSNSDKVLYYKDGREVTASWADIASKAELTIVYNGNDHFKATV